MREEEKEMNSKEICSKKCDLINGIYIGQKNESWYCKTHKRTYWPNGVPRVYTQQELDQALEAERDRVLEVIEKELSVYEKVEEMSNDLVKAQIHGIRQVRDLVKSAIETN